MLHAYTLSFEVLNPDTQVAACQWLGTDAVSGILLDKMPDAMRKDVEKSVAENPDKPKPPRLTRSQAAARKAEPAVAVGVEGLGEYPEGGLQEAAAPVDESDDDDAVRPEP